MGRQGVLAVGAAALALCGAAALDSLPVATAAAQDRGGAQPPTFQVDPLWPKPLPNHWILGSVTGVWVDAQDHVWLVHRGMDSLTARTEAGLGTDPPTAEACCAPAPPVLEFDAAGTLVGHWGGPAPNVEWPQSPGGITVDAKGNVWIAAAGVPDAAGGRGRSSQPDAAGRGNQPDAAGRAAQPPAGGRAAAPAAAPRPQDAHVLAFTRAGAFVRAIGKAGAASGSDSTTGFNRPANVEIDTAANEIYVADGMVNHRVAVFDAATGAYKRHWGAYGAKPDEAAAAYDPNGPPSKQFSTVSCVRIAKDGMVYVCDRRNNRIQVFQKNGTFVKEGFVAKATLGEGAVWDLAFSKDPQQSFVYVADGSNQKVWVLRRDTLAVVSSVGAGGRWPGHFYGVGSVAVDSKGNLYTGETYEGKRLQKFVYKGSGGARGGNQ